MAASSSSSPPEAIAHVGLPARITVCQMDGSEIMVVVHLDANVIELHNNISRISGMPPESFVLVCTTSDGEEMVMDTTQQLSHYIRVLDPVLQLVIIATKRTCAEHKRCISCLKPFPFWKTEMVCEKCWFMQVHAARVFELDGL